jgi:predicted GIY-YIG superfamily endonuclease
MEADPSALQTEKKIKIIQPESKSEYISSAVSKTNLT